MNDPAVAAMLVALLGVDSLHFIWARLLHPIISPSISPFYVLAIATVEVGVYGLVTRQLNWKTLRDNAWFFLAIGFLIGISTNINYEAIGLLNDPGVASLLAQTGTVWGLALSLVWLKDRMLPIQGLGAALSISGLVVINFQAGEYIQLGSLLILISTFSYAMHAAVTKKYGGEIDFINFFFYRILFTTLTLSLFSMVRGGLVTPPSGKAWLFLILAGTTDVVISRTLYYLALRRMRMSMHTLFLTLSPAVTVAWSLLLFGLYPSPRQLLGGAIILGGVLLVNLGRRKSAIGTK
jgi:drug/metabolite transporter (DMT)-like permease